MELFNHEYFMKKALEEARMAFAEDEIPVGAIVVYDNKIIGRGHNQVEKLNDTTAHAEMIAITAASAALNSKFLDECTLYVTLEPCTMCIGAIQWARFHRIVYGAHEPKFGFTKLKAQDLPGKRTEIIKGVLETECGALMKEFFKQKRKVR